MLEGQFTVFARSGVASYVGLQLTPAGSYTIEATSGSVASSPVAIQVTPAATPTPTPTPAPVSISGEQPVFRANLNKKGKPTGKPVLTGFTLDFSAPLNAAQAASAANYHLVTITTKKIKNKNVHVTNAITAVAASYNAANRSVTLTFDGTQTFPTGGQLMVQPDLTSSLGRPPHGNHVVHDLQGWEKSSSEHEPDTGAHRSACRRSFP